MRENTAEAITIKEDFMQVDTRELDSKNRVNLGRKIKKLLGTRIKVESFKIFIGTDGDVLLRPSVTIPSRELWIYKDPSAYAKVKKGLRQAKEGKTHRVSDLNKFLDNL